MKIVGLILMGGRNSRMEGRKKALLTYKDRFFYQYVADAMKEAGLERVLASVEKPWEQELGLEQLVDEYDRIGPLGGIITALERLPQQGVEGILVAPCDLPRLDGTLLKELAARSSRSGLPAAVYAEGWPNPLVAVYTKDCLPVLKAQVAEGNYRATHWLSVVEHEALTLDRSGDGSRYFYQDGAGNICSLAANTLANINSQADFKENLT